MALPLVDHIRFPCGHCGKTLRIGAALAGRRGKCPGCGNLIIVPESAAAPSAWRFEAQTPPPPRTPESTASIIKSPGVVDTTSGKTVELAEADRATGLRAFELRIKHDEVKKLIEKVQKLDK